MEAEGGNEGEPAEVYSSFAVGWEGKGGNEPARERYQRVEVVRKKNRARVARRFELSYGELLSISQFSGLG